MHANIKVFDTVSKTALISFCSLNLTKKKQCQDVQLKLPQHYIKFHPDQLKSMQENEATKFNFALPLWPQAKIKITELGIKKVEVNGACKHGR